MIRPIEGLPAHVIGFVYSGKVTEDDYKKVVVPVLEKADKETGKRIRVIVKFDKDLDSISLPAVVEDAYLGLKYFRDWEKAAIASDINWLNHAIKAVGFLMPGELRIFPLNEYERALEWVESV